MKKIVDRIFAFIVFAILLFNFSIISKAETLKEGESYLYSTKNGIFKKVYHYGTGEPVTIPNNFTVYEAEMRGVWVATVYNIAINKQADTTSKAINDYKAEFLTILNRMEEFGMNTIFFQIRPSNDAFYKSKLNPWSKFLVGEGVEPGWDPLEWMIDETHKRGFDFQCWMNAYRVTTESVLPDSTKNASYYTNDQLLSFKMEAINKLADGNFAKLHPEYVVMGESDTRLILNPSEIAVQDFIVESLKEIIENYDIDGMHFDDYFYLNGSVSSDKVNTNFAGGEKFNRDLSGINILNDLGNYEEYLNNDPKYSMMERNYSLGDFRRENVNNMMRKIRAMVDNYNLENDDDVEFGSKPAAVWRSNSEYCNGSSRCASNGSNTAQEAYSSYADLFADTWKWVEEGLVDYVAPQVYYSFEDNYAPYADVVDWWNEMVTNLNIERAKANKKEIKLYIAHGMYKYRDAPTQFYNSSEIRNQIVYNKKYPSIKGSALYSYENLYIFSSTTHEDGIKYLKNNWAYNPVYPLPHGINDSDGLKVTNYNVTQDLLDGNISITFPKVENSRVYGVYKVPKNEIFDSSDISTRIIVEYSPYVENQMQTLTINNYDENYDYYIKVVSKNGYLSSESTKLDFSNINVYKSVILNDLGPINCEVLCNETIEIKIQVENILKKNLTYKAWYYENGNNKYRVVAEGNVVDDMIMFDFKAYSYQTNQSSLRIEVTDGKILTYLDTNTFNIVQTKMYPFSDNIKVVSKFLPGAAIPINFEIKNPNLFKYNYKLTLVDEIKMSRIDILDEMANNEVEIINNNFVINEEGKYHFELIITSDDKVSYAYSNSFEVIKTDFFESSSIEYSIENGDATINIMLKAAARNLDYQILVVDENDNIMQTLRTGVVKSLNIKTKWFIGTTEYKNVRIKVVIGDETWHEVAYSDKISQNVKENPYPAEEPNITPDYPSDNNNNKVSKGCSCRKNMEYIFLLTTTLVTLLYVLRKRK